MAKSWRPICPSGDLGDSRRHSWSGFSLQTLALRPKTIEPGFQKTAEAASGQSLLTVPCLVMDPQLCCEVLLGQASSHSPFWVSQNT